MLGVRSLGLDNRRGLLHDRHNRAVSKWRRAVSGCSTRGEATTGMTKEAGEAMKHRLERLNVRGTSVRCYRAGEGQPVIFLHGAGGLPAWDPFLDHLCASHQLIVPEHPGFGLSDNPTSIRTVADLAMYYLDMLDALRLPAVHLIGHSMGGWIATEIAVRQCAHLATLTLIAPAGIKPKGIASGDNFIWSAEETAHNLFADPAYAQAMLAARPSEEEIDVLLQNRFAAAKFGWEPRWLNPALEKWLHRVVVPTHVVWGRDDKLFPVAYADLWCARIAQAQLTVLDACGHLPQVEQAAATSAAVARFLAQVAA